MNDNPGLANRRVEGHESDFRSERKAAEMLDLSRTPFGQNCPQYCPQSIRTESRSAATANLLGEPLAIEQVAELLGCSPWTVRHRYLRQGLPHLQASARGKLIFFREQIIAWVEKRQRQKGGQLQ